MSPVKQKDPSIANLNSLGYNVIKVPSTDIAPLGLLAHDKTTSQLSWKGSLSRIWTSTSSEVPRPMPPRPAVNLNNTHSSQLDLGFGLNLLKGALAIFGASAPAIDLSHTTAKSLQFNYTNVSIVSIDSTEIGDYLTAGTLNVANPAVKSWVLDPASAVYVITDVLQSSSITVTATDSNGNGVKLDAPQINGIVGGNISVKPSSATNSALSFESTTTPPTLVGFGFKAIRLKWNPTPNAEPGKGTWDFEDSGNVTFAVAVGAGAPAAAEAPSGPVVFDTGAESCLLEL